MLAHGDRHGVVLDGLNCPLKRLEDVPRFGGAAHDARHAIRTREELRDSLPRNHHDFNQLDHAIVVRQRRVRSSSGRLRSVYDHHEGQKRQLSILRTCTCARSGKNILREKKTRLAELSRLEQTRSQS